MGIYTDGKEVLKDIVFLSKGITDMELKNKILEIQSIFYDLNDENRELRLENEELRNENILTQNLNFLDDVYYYDKEGPYCTRCWDVDRKLVRMISIRPTGINGMSNFQCNNCNSKVSHSKTR